MGAGKLKFVWRAALARGVHNWLDQRHAVTLGLPVVGGTPGHGLSGETPLAVATLPVLLPKAMKSRGFQGAVLHYWLVATTASAITSVKKRTGNLLIHHLT